MGSRFGLVLALTSLAACGTLIGGSDDEPTPSGGTTDGVDASRPADDGAIPTRDATSTVDASDASNTDADAGASPPRCDGGPMCERVVFVTSSTLAGNFQTLSAADQVCNTLAATTGGPRVKGRAFLAWISNTSNNGSASARLVHATARYVLPDTTTVVASDWTQLTSGTLAHAIDHMEDGGALPNAAVWTGTQQNGTANGTNCTEWASTSGNGKSGNSSKTGSGWTDNTDLACNTAAHFYCIEK